MPKTGIIERLGETAVLLPGLIAEALAANDRAKLRLTMLQEAAARAAEPGRAVRTFETERQAAGLDDPGLDRLIAGAAPLDDGRFTAPGAAALAGGLATDLAAMLAPIKAAQAPEHADLERRLARLGDLQAAMTGDTLSAADVGRLTSARQDGPDSVHRLVMDLHRAINRLAADTAVDDVDGAKAHGLHEGDRLRVAAFMRGLNRTAPLAFGHPGLGTMAARLGERLTLQNDIGETDAHVLVLHVDGLTVSATYTDVHRRRAKFFMGLFDERMVWSPLAEQAANGLGDDERFYLVTGVCQAADEAALDAFLEFLASRIVFLIDWNKARKALQTFVERDVAISLLRWAAGHDLGHRAFLELGGADLVLEAVRRGAAGRVPYGERLDGALGEAETVAFLRGVLQCASEGLRAGRSARLIRDEVQADLAQRFDTAENGVLAAVVRHLGLSRTLAAELAEAIDHPPDAGGAQALAERAKRLEAKADRLTLQAREACARLQGAEGIRRLVDSVEDAMDALDEAAFLLSLVPPGSGSGAPLSELAAIVVEAVAGLVRAVEIATRLPEGRREDAAAALEAIDAVTEAERAADTAERAAIARLTRARTDDARILVLSLELARALEESTDHLAHAALALRERVLEELSA